VVGKGKSGRGRKRQRKERREGRRIVIEECSENEECKWKGK